MSEYVVSTCSTADLSKESMEKYGLKYAMYHYILDGKVYPDNLYQDITAHEFYKMIMDGAAPTTSQISVTDYLEFWEPTLEAGKDVLHVCMSSGISGSANSARLAAEMAREKYPERKIYAIDSLCASPGHGLISFLAKQNQDNGMDIDENAKWLEEHKANVRTWFFVSDLTCLIRGGRVSKLAGTFGKMLNICPLMYVAKDGTLQVQTKVRGRKNAIKAAFNCMVEQAENGKDYSRKVMITHSDCYEDAKAVAELIEEYFPKMDGKVEIYDIGTVIGCHTGPGTVALAFFGTEKEK